MLDSVMQPDLATEIRKLNSRIERLEMSARNVNQQRFMVMYGTPQALAPDPAFLASGVHAYFTDSSSLTNVMAGDFITDGQYIYGAFYTWCPPGNSLEFEVLVREYGATAQVILTGSSSDYTEEHQLGGLLIPDAAFVDATNKRGRFFRLDVNIRRSSGADRVGIAVSGSPYTYPF